MKRAPRLKGSIDQPIDNHAFDLLSGTLAVVLVLHAPHLPWWLGAALASILGWRWWQRRRQARGGAAGLDFAVVGILTQGGFAGFGRNLGREPGTALAVGLLVLKLLESETERDARVGVSFACFALMVALLFDQGLIATLVVALGLLPALATLRSLQPARLPATVRRTVLSNLGLLCAALPLALLAFLLVPRLSTPLWGAPSPRQATTGLSDSMTPGNFTELLTDDRPAMRVSFDGSPPAPDLRYFRAYVMGYYDGRGWHRRSADPRRALAEIEAGTTVSYRITLQPTRQRVLPTLDVPLRAPAQARLQPDREVLADKAVTEPISYAATSASHYRLQTVLDPASRQRGLQLPAGFNPRTHALAAQWRQRAGSDDAAIVQMALALYHDGGFRYTLAPAPLGRDSIDDFLFSTQEGFCEHYASSFTVLMRAAGIPARVVTGYQGGYWNKLADYLLVRNSDAHAWSEVWLAGRGWVRVDPTAAVRPERVTLGAAAAAGDQRDWYRNDWLQEVRNRWDVVNRWWDQAVVGFDALRQRGLLTPFGIRDTDTGMLGLLLAIGSVLFVALGLGWALWRREARDPLRMAMHRLERKLARGGITRRSSEGPQHYLRRAARAFPAQRRELETLMNLYLSLRYAQDHPTTDAVRAFSVAVREFRPVGVVK
jgi:transglutaminase-like putative cysteine protease